jgi:hypothetical protein
LIAALSERCMKELSKDLRKRVLAARKNGQINWHAEQCDDTLDVDDIAD